MLPTTLAMRHRILPAAAAVARASTRVVSLRALPASARLVSATLTPVLLTALRGVSTALPASASPLRPQSSRPNATRAPVTTGVTGVTGVAGAVNVVSPLHARYTQTALRFLSASQSLSPAVQRRTLSTFAAALNASSSAAGSISAASASASASASSPSLGVELWRVLSQRLPKGFGSFFPKREGDDKSKSDADDAEAKGNGNGNGNGNDKKPDDDDGGGKNKDKETDSKGKDKESENAGESDKKKKSSSSSSSSSTPSPGNSQWMTAAMVGLTVLMILSAAIPSNSTMARGEEVSFQQFLTQYLAPNKVEKLVVINNSIATVYLKETPGVSALYFAIGSVDSFERKLQAAQESLDLDPRDWVPVTYKQQVNVMVEVMKSLPTLLLIGMTIYFFRNVMGDMGAMTGTKRGGRNIFSFGKSPATLIKPGEKTKISFKDVAGLDEAKVEVMEFVKFLKNPAKFTKLGAKIPKGALLVGPPGTGKTLLAKATAGEASVPFFSISGSDFIEMFVGVGPSRVRDLFAEARKSAPCIVFIDEIDAVGRSRSKGGFSGGNDERENTLNQLLVEMDGFNTESGVVVLAGTNRADILDKALLRPGRFDRQINIDKPDIKGRKQIFLVHLKGLKLGHSMDDLANRLAALTPGFAGADIANVCNEAALIAARGDKKTVELVDFESACDRVIGGLEKKHSVMSVEERRLVAYHEAGHAVVGWMLEHAHPVLKVTIVPRGKGALGFAQYLPQELALYQQQQLQDMMSMTLGGRAAEFVFFGKVSTGAADDLKKVTKLAYAQVTNFGFSEKLGNISFAPDDGDSQFTKPFSEATAQIIDSEVSTLVRESYDRTVAIVTQHKAKVEALAERLLKDETVNHDVIVEVLGKRQFTSKVYSDYVATKESDKIREDKEKQKQKDKADANTTAAASAAAGTAAADTTATPAAAATAAA